ncbi:MAG TPA: alpha-1,4-glucan--maltose-1-phosphate maltosyltransferase [Nitrososphaerales archaeon]|nr:alpha-1,4-glucan--maltose-1-phosphate maltosyltransferase [Nitrososphaerales archaeon]
MESEKNRDESIRLYESSGLIDRKQKLPTSAIILNVSPQVECGRFPVKRIVGDILEVSADVLKPGHELLTSYVNWRMQGNRFWKREAMTYNFDEDKWSAALTLSQLGVCEFFIEAWKDPYSTKLRDVAKWIESGEDVSSDIAELVDIGIKASFFAPPEEKSIIKEKLNEIATFGEAPFPESDRAELIKLLSEPIFSRLVTRNLEKEDYNATNIFQVIVDRSLSRYSTWYEMFHRSQGILPDRSASFKECESRIEEINGMGFDVIYFPPIHPIGHTNRRGPNNTQSISELDPGSPWAIGSELGGHDSMNPDLGSMEDFLHLVSKARQLGIEIALDLAFQVSPDHPYARLHSNWFYKRSDGTTRYAENPPKKYYDIYPLNFENEDWKKLWEELHRVVVFWIGKGIRTFRVDNPHTKPIAFWEWMLSSIRTQFPDVIFLSEAFTRPKQMKLLAKTGFNQSYTYFTWKNSKNELTDFIREFFFSEVIEYYRPNLFTNTPDILPEYLQTGGRPAFKIRETLAATLSSSYGIYNGFELCESRAKSEGSEEYLDSEKYQYKVWDWNREGNIKEYISKINKIRKENPALQENSNLRLLECTSDQIIFYGKWSKDLSNVILVAVNLDPFSAHEGIVKVPVKELGLDGQYVVRDLVSGSTFSWRTDSNYVRLDPKVESAHILKLER